MNLTKKIGIGLGIFGGSIFMGGIIKGVYDTFQGQHYKNKIELEQSYENPDKEKISELRGKQYDSVNSSVWDLAIGFAGFITFLGGNKLYQQEAKEEKKAMYNRVH